MAYIGKTPIVGNFQKCDAISVVNGQAAYTLQVGSTNVSPESVNHMIVSLNGVIQSPTTAYTVAGATLTFASNLATGDVIDFVILLGNVLDVGTPTDNTVATAKIQDDAVTLAKMAAGTDGNIISYDASGNPVAIATGNDGQVLTSTGAGSPPAFEAIPGGGKVLQVLQTTDTTERSTSSTGSWVTCSNTMSQAITCAATSSKVLILTTFTGQSGSGSVAGTIYRDSTNLGDSSWGFGRNYGADHYGNFGFAYLDSPSSTSELVYQVRINASAGVSYINRYGGTGQIIVMEIGA